MLLTRTRRSMLLGSLLSAWMLGAGLTSAQTGTSSAGSIGAGVSVAGAGANGVLTKDAAGALMPPTVFFRGKTAPVQARNAGGVRFDGDRLIMAALVDTSGYSTRVQERYQAYLITEATLVIEGHRLPPGAYGVGFVAGDRFAVMDLGGHDLFVAASHTDAALRRPMPLQIVAGQTDGQFRLYVGRSYVDFSRAADESR